MKLIKKPYRGGTGRCDKMVYTITGGKEYNVKALSEHAGVDHRTILGRISQLGWNHQDILKQIKHGSGRMLKTFNAEEALEILKASDKVCPIMQGATNLRITRKAWNTACKFHQERVAGNNNKYSSNRYCFVCAGSKVPKGVDFITKKELACFVEGRV